MFRLLFAPFIAIPLAEVFLLVWLSRKVGIWPTVLLTVLTGLAGAWLLKREGRRALAAYRRALETFSPPELGLIEGLLIVVGGAFLLTPGVITDVLGFVLLLPPTRRPLASLLRRQLLARVELNPTRARRDERVVVEVEADPNATSAEKAEQSEPRPARLRP